MNPALLPFPDDMNPGRRLRAGVIIGRVSDDPARTAEYREDEPEERGEPYLEVVRGARLPGPVELAGKNVVVLGRDASCGLVLSANGVSRKHAKVLVGPDGTVSLIDLGSRNGTFLNRRRVEVAPLRDGDEIRIGQAVLRLRFVLPGGVLATSPSEESEPSITEMLSPRELEVAQLVGEGLTNAAIGRRLSISPGTVGRHLSNIYERLDIHSRAALAKLIASRR